MNSAALGALACCLSLWLVVGVCAGEQQAMSGKVTVEKQGTGAYLARFKGVLKYPGRQDAASVTLTVKCDDCDKACDVCARGEKWQLSSASHDLGAVKAGENQDVDVVVAELKAGVPAGREPAPPKVAMGVTTGQKPVPKRYMDAGDEWRDPSPYYRPESQRGRFRQRPTDID
jgi:hypothetical protein